MPGLDLLNIMLARSVIQQLPMLARIAIGAVIIACAVLLALLAWHVFGRSNKRKQEIERNLEICNEGNSRSRYDVRAQDLGGALKFEFRLNGVALNQHTEVVKVLDPTVLAAQPAVAQGGGEPAKDSSGSGGDRTGQAAKTGGVLLNIFGTIGDVLYSLGLPIGARMRHMGGTVRQVGQLKQGTDKVQPPQFSSGAPSPTASQDQPAQGAALVYGTVKQIWSQTPMVEAGETLRVNLLVRPIHPSKRTEAYHFSVISRPAEQAAAAEVAEKASIQIEELPYYFRFLPVFVDVLIAAITLFILGMWV